LYNPKGNLLFIVDVIDNKTDVYPHLHLAILGDYDISKGSKILIPVFLHLAGMIMYVRTNLGKKEKVFFKIYHTIYLIKVVTSQWLKNKNYLTRS
jgi:hypothetical protein